MKKLRWIAGSLVALGFAVAAIAQVITVPQVTQIGAGDLFLDIVGGSPQANNQYATAAQLGTYGNTLTGGNAENAIVGGDFGTNLFQRGTSVGSITTTALYTADRWIAWSGTATTLTVTQQTGAGDITARYSASLRVNKGSGAGVVQSCIAQEIESVNSYRFQGTTAEFDFHAKAGANFSAASSNLQVSIVYGTGVDEGTSKLAFQFNGGGGGSSTWAGQTNAASNLLVPITTGWARYTVVAAIPATATELAVIICYTPVGTGVAGDWFEFTGAQLVVNPALTAAAGAAGAVLSPNDSRAKAFYHRPQEIETALQQRYTYSINERNSAGAVQTPLGSAQGTTTTCTMYIPFPVVMRAAPTYTNAITATTWTMVSDSQTATVLATPFSATLGANSVNGASINFTTTGMTAKDACFLTSTAAGGGQMLWTAEL